MAKAEGGAVNAAKVEAFQVTQDFNFFFSTFHDKDYLGCGLDHFDFPPLLGIFCGVPYLGIGEMIQFDVSFSDGLKNFQQPDDSFW